MAKIIEEGWHHQQRQTAKMAAAISMASKQRNRNIIGEEKYHGESESGGISSA